jgi:hypothetical protein
VVSLLRQTVPVLASLTIACQLLVTPRLSAAATPANPQHWMADISDQIAKVPLKGIAIPGSHDSAMWDPDYGPNAVVQPPFPINVIDGFMVTQSGDINYQLAHGVRWFDIRSISLQNQKCSGAETSSTEMYFSPHTGIYLYGHGNLCTHELLTDALTQVATFIQENPKEIVILSLAGGYSPAHEQALQSTLVNRDGTSMVYDHSLACSLSGNDFTPPADCDGPTLYPQNMTPEALWKTPARVIVVDPNDAIPYSNLTWGKTNPTKANTIENVEFLQGWNDNTSGTGSESIMFSFLDYGTQGSPNQQGLFFERPKYASYTSAPTLFVSQACLTPFARGTLHFLDDTVDAGGINVALPMLADARQLNPTLARLLQSQQTPPSLPAPGNFENTNLHKASTWGWFPYAVNVVEMDFPDIAGAQAVIAFNDEQWGEIPAGANQVGAMAAGRDGSVYKLDSVGVSGTDGILYKWFPNASAWAPVNVNFTLVTGVRVAVDASGNPWVVSSRGQISKQIAPGQWADVPGSLTAKDIAIGYNGQAWAIGQDQQIYKYDSFRGQWNRFNIPSGDVPFHIAADAQGNLLLVTAEGVIRYFQNASTITFALLPFKATSIGFGGGKIWATGHDSGGTTGIWSLTSPSTWIRHRNSGSEVAVDSAGQPWLLRAGNLMIGKFR